MGKRRDKRTSYVFSKMRATVLDYCTSYNGGEEAGGGNYEDSRLVVVGDG
jgi:hypothetical protein